MNMGLAVFAMLEKHYNGVMEHSKQKCNIKINDTNSGTYADFETPGARDSK